MLALSDLIWRWTLYLTLNTHTYCKKVQKRQLQISESGAEYTYIREAFGSLAAFLFVWVKLSQTLLSFNNLHILMVV